jgi:hypothetical protein
MRLPNEAPALDRRRSRLRRFRALRLLLGIFSGDEAGGMVLLALLARRLLLFLFLRFLLLLLILILLLRPNFELAHRLHA